MAIESIDPQAAIAETTFDRLTQSANNNHGLTLQPIQVRAVMATFYNMVQQLQQLQQALYVQNEELIKYNTQFGPLPTEEEVVEGEVVDGEEPVEVSDPQIEEEETGLSGPVGQ